MTTTDQNFTSHASNKGCGVFMVKERQRYERKGFGILVAAAIFLAFFWAIPELGQLYWPRLMEWKEAMGISYVAFVVTWVVLQHNVVYLVVNAIYQVYYHFEIPFFEKYKTNYEEPWPWNEDKEAWKRLMKQTIPVFLFNSNVVMPLVYYLNSLTSGHVDHSINVEDIPSPIELACTIFFCMLCEDFTFYFAHRFLHLPFIYPYIHKMHHRFTTTVGLAAEYAHPVEFVIGNMLPTSVGPLILGHNMHLISVFTWYMVRVGESLDGHCGYDFSFSPYRLIPFSGSAAYHDFHHSANVGNYGSFFSIWDTVFGTNKPFYEYLAEREKKTK